MDNIDPNDFRGVDLNLLVTFMVLMRERSVSRTAGRLYLGQPAVSGALARLRKLLDDDLLVRTSQGMVPTPKALQVADQLAPAMEIIERVLFRPHGFEPATAQRTFRLAVPDWLEARLMPALLRRVSTEAPNSRISIQPLRVQEVSQLLADDRIDIAISIFPPGPSWQRSRPLLATRLCCVYDRRRLNLPSPLTRSQYLSHPHVLVSFQGGFDGLIDEAIGRLKRQRRILYATQVLATLPFLLQHAPVLATVPDYIGREWSDLFGLQASPLPIRTPPLTVSMVWHARTDGDAALDWLRGLVASIAGDDQAGRGAPRLRTARDRPVGADQSQ
jgi:DNA-binding transcriptional LysR family regulator